MYTGSSRSPVLVMVSFQMLEYCWFGVHLSTVLIVHLFGTPVCRKVLLVVIPYIFRSSAKK